MLKSIFDGRCPGKVTDLGLKSNTVFQAFIGRTMGDGVLYKPLKTPV